MAFHYDPEAEKRSLMLKQKALCSGEKHGRSCVFYWTHVEKVESANADNLRRGEIYRACCFPGTGSTLHVHEMSASQLATECNQFKPRKLPILQRPLAWVGLKADPGKYDPNYEAYDPLTPEEIRKLQSETPSQTEDRQAVVGIGESNIAAFKEEVEQELSLNAAMDALEEDSGAGGIFEDKQGENTK